MNQDRKDFLNLVTPPARLTLTEAAWYLGFGENDISVLVAAGLLKPLGRPPSSGSKYFGLSELQVVRTDLRWLAKASDTTVSFWRQKNAGRVRQRPEPVC